MIDSDKYSGQRTRQWRAEKEAIISMRSHGKTQGKVLANIVHHTNQMIRQEMSSKEYNSRKEKVKKWKAESLIQKRAQTTPSPYKAVKTPVAVPTFDVDFDATARRGEFHSTGRPLSASATHSSRKERLQTRVRALSPNLPLKFTSLRADLREDSGVLSEQSRALRRYEHVAHHYPRCKFHLPYTDSFPEGQGEDPPLPPSLLAPIVGAPQAYSKSNQCLLDEALQSTGRRLLEGEQGDYYATLRSSRRDSRRDSNSLSLRLPSTHLIAYDPKKAVDYLTFCTEQSDNEIPTPGNSPNKTKALLSPRSPLYPSYSSKD